MFDINNLGDIKTLQDGDQTLILRFGSDGFADLMQCDFSMLMENNTSIWYNGTYAPSGTTTPNSYYINTSTGEIYSSTTSKSGSTSTTTWQLNPIMKITGSKGDNGTNGESAYEIAVANGYTGTVTQWLASLLGANGPDGTRTYFVYSVPTGEISDSRGTCRIGDYAIVTFATTGDSPPEAGQTYVYQGAGQWKGPLTISKATTGPMGPAVTLESTSSITTTEISEGVYEVSLAQNYLALNAQTNNDQIIAQGTNSTAYSISNSSGAQVNIGVSLSGTTNMLTLSSAKTTGLLTVNNDGDKALISPDGSYLDNNSITTDGSGNITAISYLGNGNNLTVTDPTTSSSASLSTALANIQTKEGNYLPLSGGTVKGNLIVSGTTSLDKGNITTDGSGNVIIQGNTSFGSNTTPIVTSDVYGQCIIGPDPHPTQRKLYANLAVLNTLVTPGSSDYNENPFNIFVYGVNTLTLKWNTTNSSLQWYDYNRNNIVTETFYDGTQNFKVYGKLLTNGITSTGSLSLDNNKIITDGSGNLTAVSFIGNGNNLSVTDPTTSSSASLSTALANIYSPESGFITLGKANTYTYTTVPTTITTTGSTSTETMVTINDTSVGLATTDSSTFTSGLATTSTGPIMEYVKLSNYANTLSVSDSGLSYNTSYLGSTNGTIYTSSLWLNVDAGFQISGYNSTGTTTNAYGMVNSPTIFEIMGGTGADDGFSLAMRSTLFSIILTSSAKTTEVFSYNSGFLSLNSTNFSVDMIGNISSNNISTSVSEGLTSTGTSLSTALALSSSTNVITTVTSGSGVSLPDVSVGTTVRILNRGANTLLIYPEASTSQIETLSVGVAQSMVSGGSGEFMKTSSTMWRVV